MLQILPIIAKENATIECHITQKIRTQEAVWGRRMYIAFLFQSGNSKSKISRLLGMSRQNIIWHLREHDFLAIYDRDYKTIWRRIGKTLDM